jgi:hypothetical protein
MANGSAALLVIANALFIDFAKQIFSAMINSLVRRTKVPLTPAFWPVDSAQQR